MSLDTKLAEFATAVGVDMKNVTMPEYGVAIYGNVPLGGYPLARSTPTSGVLRRVYCETDGPLVMELVHNETVIWSNTVDGTLQEALDVSISKFDQLTLNILSGTSTKCWLQVDGVEL